MGGLALLSAGVPLDVENPPGPDTPYRATAIVILPQIAAPTGDSRAFQTTDARAVAAFDRAAEMVRRPAVPQSIRDQAVLEGLSWFEAGGIRLPPPCPARYTDRVRVLLARDLARDWTAEAVVNKLATRQPTLWRLLADEGESFADLLTDLPMNRALGLLQGSDRSVAVIAQDVGYASPSRCALRFLARFGISPGTIRQG